MLRTKVIKYEKSSSIYDKKPWKSNHGKSQLKTKYFKTNIAGSLRLYKKQNSFCSKLYKKERKKERKKYYSRLKLNKVTVNKALWKTIKPFLSDKGLNINKITLLDNDYKQLQMISNYAKLVVTFSKKR